MRIFRTLFFARRSILRVVPLMRDDRVSLGLKGVVVAVALFIVSPFNVLSDIPLLGFFDDAALLLLLSSWFANRATHQVERRVPPAPGSTLAV
ncbi:MAG: DUF1232 domain-containing protein [Rhodanobacteraceae bacterium]